MDIRLKIVTEDDKQVLLDMIRAYHQFENLPFDANKIGLAINKLVNSKDAGVIWLILCNNNPIGYLVLGFGYSIEFSGRDTFIDKFFIEEACRGQGIGREALGLVKQEVKAMGVNAIHLEVARDNNAAHNLYQSAGFKKRERYVLMSIDLD